MKPKMQVHLYCLCWNEARILPYFFRHYDAFVDKYFIFDNHSTDGSIEILKKHPKVVLNIFAVTGSSFVEDAMHFYNQCWKQSRNKADWVIVVNIDEHLYHPRILQYLKRCKQESINLIYTIGYQMLSKHFPNKKQKLYKLIKQGIREKQYDKFSIFNPNAIEEMHYVVGRHAANPAGDIHMPETNQVKLLHFKYLGLDYLASRYNELSQGLKQKDIEKKYGSQYFLNYDELKTKFESLQQQAKAVYTWRDILASFCFWRKI